MQYYSVPMFPQIKNNPPQRNKADLSGYENKDET